MAISSRTIGYISKLSEILLSNIEAIESRWQDEQYEMWLYLNSLENDQLDSVIRYAIRGGRRQQLLWQILFYILDDSIQCRSEVAILLTKTGFPSGDLDFSTFLHQQG